MPKTAFPLSKNNSFRLGIGWDWCVHHVAGKSGEFRLLIAYHRGKSDYLAWLGQIVGNDTAILARLEFHKSHLGWHVHLKAKEVADVSLGVVKQPGEKLVDCSHETPAPMTNGEATTAAFKMFNVGFDGAEVFQ